MKALTIWQPWASYIAHGMKGYETRSWPTSYRGEIAIHAAARPLTEGERWLLEEHPLPDPWADPVLLPFGAIVATARLSDVILCSGLFPAPSSLEDELGDFSPGRFAWKLEDVVRLPHPVPVRGAQGLWEWRRQ